MREANHSEKQLKVLKLQTIVVEAVIKPLTNFNIHQIAEAIGMSVSTLSNLRNAKRIAGREMVCVLSAYMNDDQLRVWLALLLEYDRDTRSDWQVHLAGKIEMAWPGAVDLRALQEALA